MEVVDRCGEECQVEGKTDELREPGAGSADAAPRFGTSDYFGSPVKILRNCTGVDSDVASV